MSQFVFNNILETKNVWKNVVSIDTTDWQKLTISAVKAIVLSIHEFSNSLLLNWNKIIQLLKALNFNYTIFAYE